MKKIAVLGKQQTIVKSGEKTVLDILVTGKKGNLLSGEKIKVKSSDNNFKLSVKEISTGNDGQAKVEVTAPKTHGKNDTKDL